MAGPSAGSNAVLETTTAGTSTVGDLPLSQEFENGRRRGKPGESPIPASTIRDRYIKGARAIRPQARQYWINRAFIEGQQWIWWDRVRDQVNELPRDERVRAVMNILWGNSRRIISKLTQRELVFEVPPQAPDDAAILGAVVAEAVLRHTWKEHKWEDIRTEIEWMRWLGGTAVLGMEWDPQAGTALGFNPTGQSYGTGDLKSQVYSIGEVCTEPGSRDIERANWWVRALALPPDEVQQRYNLKDAPEADAAANLQPWQARVTMVERGEMPLPLTLVLTYYERPNPSRPDGVVATVVGDQVVEWDEWPFPFKDRLNLVCFRETKISDRWFGATVFSAGIPIQTAYNAVWSSQIEHMKAAGNARIMSPEGAVEDEDQFTDDPASVLTYNGAAGGKPEYLAPPAMPQWWVEQPQMIENVLNDILAINDVSKGSAPSNIESGVGLSILQDADETPISMMVKDGASGWARYAQMVLQLYRSKVTETRTARITVEGQRAPMCVRWTGKAFNNQTEVEVPLEAIVPRSKAAQQAWATALWDRGMLNQDPKLFARIVELPTRDDFTAGLDPHLAKSQRENQIMVVGGVPIPEPFDDHAKHITSHNEFRVSERYENLPTQYRTIVDNHVLAHANLAAENAAKMALRQQVSPALEAAPNAEGAPAVPALHAPMLPPAAGPAGALPAGPQSGQSPSQVAEQMANAAPQPGDPAVEPGNQHPGEVFTPPMGADYPVDGLRAPSRLGPTI